MKNMLSRMKIEKVDGILLDLGVSSHQLDTAERGFSFALDAPLDMRMDRSRGPSAYDLVNTLSREALEEILRKFGEERRAGRIARDVLGDVRPFLLIKAEQADVVMSLERVTEIRRDDAGRLRTTLTDEQIESNLAAVARIRDLNRRGVPQ